MKPVSMVEQIGSGVFILLCNLVSRLTLYMRDECEENNIIRIDIAAVDSLCRGAGVYAAWSYNRIPGWAGG